MAERRRNHVLPRGYLKLFANHDDRILVHLVASGFEKEMSTKNAGVRKDFYTGWAPDGQRSTELEQRLGLIEDPAIPVLRKIDARWPLSEEEEWLVAEFVAVQVARSPAWRTFFDDFTDDWLTENVRQAPNVAIDVAAELEREIGSDHTRMVRLIRNVVQMATLFGSMQLTLLTFGPGRLVASDHPVVCVPLDPNEPIGAIPKESGLAA